MNKTVPVLQGLRVDLSTYEGRQSLIGKVTCLQLAHRQAPLTLSPQMASAPSKLPSSDPCLLQVKEDFGGSLQILGKTPCPLP